jgi:hypothetical protein
LQPSLCPGTWQKPISAVWMLCPLFFPHLSDLSPIITSLRKSSLVLHHIPSFMKLLADAILYFLNELL